MYNSVYAKKVAFLLRLMPFISKVEDVKKLLTEEDKTFLLSFELASPLWDKFEFPYMQEYPSVKWKQQNLAKLKKHNPQKLQAEASKLSKVFQRD